MMHREIGKRQRRRPYSRIIVQFVARGRRGIIAA
jgi:hypothetical protein